jgi:hypothetical protein
MKSAGWREDTKGLIIYSSRCKLKVATQPQRHARFSDGSTVFGKHPNTIEMPRLQIGAVTK